MSKPCMMCHGTKVVETTCPDCDNTKDRPMTTPPDTIYLQWYGDADPDDVKKPPMSMGEVSWWKEPVFPGDIEYRRVDAAPGDVESVAKAIAEEIWNYVFVSHQTQAVEDVEQIIARHLAPLHVKLVEAEGVRDTAVDELQRFGEKLTATEAERDALAAKLAVADGGLDQIAQERDALLLLVGRAMNRIAERPHTDHACWSAPGVLGKCHCGYAELAAEYASLTAQPKEDTDGK